MATPHITAENGEVAKRVLMPGDPLRAKFIAETFLDSPKLFNNTRGMLGYTGTYKDQPISVMGSGMGIPSIGIYSYELFSFYGVDEIIRIGSCGGYSENLNLFDVMLVTDCFSKSTYAKMNSGYDKDVIASSPLLNDKIRASASSLGTTLIEGRAYSADAFYSKPFEGQKPFWQVARDEHNCLAVEMESFGLFHNANVLGKQAACILTVSDSIAKKVETTAEQREKSFTGMMEIALNI